MPHGAPQALALASGAVVLLLVRAVVAALEAALVAVGLPRAQALAAEGVRRGARALAALLEAREWTAAFLRVTDTASALGAGVLAAAAGAAAVPWPLEGAL